MQEINFSKKSISKCKGTNFNSLNLSEMMNNMSNNSNELVIQ